jgi:hypothetical protein
MKVRIVTEVEVHEASKLLEKARLVHFQEAGEWLVPGSIGEAVLALLRDDAPPPLDCGFEVVEQRAEEVRGRDRHAFVRAVKAWKENHDFAGEEKRFQDMVDSLEALGDESILDDVIHDLVSQDGSDINNQGFEGQLGYLIGALGWEEAAREVGAVIQPSHPSDDS